MLVAPQLEELELQQPDRIPTHVAQLPALTTLSLRLATDHVAALPPSLSGLQQLHTFRAEGTFDRDENGARTGSELQRAGALAPLPRLQKVCLESLWFNSLDWLQVGGMSLHLAILVCPTTGANHKWRCCAGPHPDQRPADELLLRIR